MTWQVFFSSQPLGWEAKCLQDYEKKSSCPQSTFSTSRWPVWMRTFTNTTKVTNPRLQDWIKIIWWSNGNPKLSVCWHDNSTIRVLPLSDNVGTYDRLIGMRWWNEEWDGTTSHPSPPTPCLTVFYIILIRFGIMPNGWNESTLPPNVAENDTLPPLIQLSWENLNIEWGQSLNGTSY